MAPQRRREPRVEDVLVATQAGWLATERSASLCACLFLIAPHVNVAAVVVPRGNPMAPPQLARNAPVLDVVEPMAIPREPFVGHEGDLLSCARGAAR